MNISKSGITLGLILACCGAGCSDTERFPLLPPLSSSTNDAGGLGGTRGEPSSKTGDTSPMGGTGGSGGADATAGGADATESATGGNTADSDTQGNGSTPPDSGSTQNVTGGTSTGEDPSASTQNATGGASTGNVEPEADTAGGEPQEPAVGGGSPCPVPKTSLPTSTCATINGGKFPYIDFRSASAVANSGLTLFATQTADHIAAVAWQPIADTGQTFTRWACFDYVPHIHRIAAHEHADGTEVLATTVDGRLYARFSPHGPWTDWARLAGPYQDSCILDVTAPRTNDGNNYRFVNDHGVIYEMHLEGDSFDTFSSWEQVGVSGGSRIAATDIDGHKCVVALDADGLPELACTVEPEPGSPFTDLEALGQARPVLQGIAAGVLPTGEAQAFGVDREGTLWRLRTLASHWENTWESMGTSSGSERIIDVSTALLRDDTFAILGVTAAGLVLRRANTSGSSWQPLAM